MAQNSGIRNSGGGRDGSPVSFTFFEAESGERIDVTSACGKKLVDVVPRAAKLRLNQLLSRLRPQ